MIEYQEGNKRMERIEAMDEKAKEEMEFEQILFDLLEVEQSEKEVIRYFLSKCGVPLFMEQYRTIAIHTSTKDKLDCLVHILKYVGGMA